jgi:quercetin dioxygenase-like cupin family protein
MTKRHSLSRLILAIAAATTTAVLAAELDPAAVAHVTPDQFKWRDPTDQVATNQATLYGDPNKNGLYIYINKFKPGRFGNPHYHPNDRFITVIDGASWHGTGTVVDPAQAKRVSKGTFMIDHASKVHWGGNKDEGGSYLITGMGPATSVEVPKGNDPWAGGDPSAATIMLPEQIPWRDYGTFRLASLARAVQRYLLEVHRKDGFEAAERGGVTVLGDCVGLIEPQDIVSEAAHSREDAGVFSDARCVFAERDVTRVMELVLDAPVLANGDRGMVCIDQAVGQIE